MFLHAIMRTTNYLKTRSIRRILFSFLTEIQQERPDTISEDVNIGDNYGIVRSFIRGEYFRALNTKVPEMVISAIN